MCMQRRFENFNENKEFSVFVQSIGTIIDYLQYFIFFHHCGWNCVWSAELMHCLIIGRKRVVISREIYDDGNAKTQLLSGTVPWFYLTFCSLRKSPRRRVSIDFCAHRRQCAGSGSIHIIVHPTIIYAVIG